MVLAVVAALGSAVSFGDEEEGGELLRTDSRAPYVHRITLYDHGGGAIDPEDEPALPYSPRTTCGKCHPYAQIAHGWHFGASDSGADPGQPGEPWFVIDEQTSVVQPVSERGWPGTRKLSDMGWSHWDFVKRFGGHTPGGGFGEPSDAVVEDSDEWLRWSVSGKLEIDCMFCHSASRQHDPAEAARQIEKENFKWAPTVALGLGVVRGEARKAPDEWDPYTPPNPDYPDQAGPLLIYDRTRFDPDDRVLFDVTGRPPAERCYFCHTVREVGADAPLDWQTDRDVHLAAGLTCVDCHRHGLDHDMTRGYEGEAHPTTQPTKASLSCRGCHLGVAGATAIEAALGGRLRAPHPGHAGLPPLHLEKLSCTVCHSGPWPGMTTKRFQTSLAHGLGTASRDRTAQTPPEIVGPAFVERAGVIVPTRLVHGADIVADSYTWPLAHDVRPAAQALGVRGCEDCHGDEGAIFFGEVVLGMGSKGTHAAMREFNGYPHGLASIWAFAFQFRPLFKWFGFACAGLIALVLLRKVLGVPSRGVVMDSRWHDLRSRMERLSHNIALLGAAILAITGFGASWILGELSGWMLLAHMAGSPLLMVGLVGVPLVRAWNGHNGIVGLPPKLCWLALLLGLVTMMTVLVAMLSVCGYEEQRLLAKAHMVSGLALVLTVIALGIAGRQPRGKTRWMV